jgi:hypothetical protein
MKPMHRLFPLALFAAVLSAQTDNPFNRPPAEVDAALRARATEFFEYHVKGEFRKAESLVAEDTKEFFYTHNKPRYLGIEISRIEYSANFTRAKVVVICEQYVMMPGFSDKPIKVPTPSTWKVENGKWYWYVDPDSLGQSPFGKMTPGPGPSAGSMPSVPALPRLGSVPTTPDFLFTQVKADKQSVSLKAGESDQVTFLNGAPGMITLSLQGKLPGIEAKFDRTSFQAGEKAVLTLKAGSDAKPGVLNVQVEQTTQLIQIQVTVK